MVYLLNCLGNCPRSVLVEQRILDYEGAIECEVHIRTPRVGRLRVLQGLIYVYLSFLKVLLSYPIPHCIKLRHFGHIPSPVGVKSKRSYFVGFLDRVEGEEFEELRY